MWRSVHRPGTLGALALFALCAPACDGGVSDDDAELEIAVVENAGTSTTLARSQPADGLALMARLGCGACHAGVPAPARGAVALSAGSGPRNPAALFVYLSDSLPARVATGATMPDFDLDEPEALALALYLGRGRADGDGRRAFETTRDDHEDIRAEDGARLFEAFACGACHGGSDRRADAPGLAAEGARVRPEWLRSFLRAPHAIRPFGATPGSGSRMPDFGLAEDEVDAIAAVLLANGVALPEFEPSPVTPFQTAKTEALLDTRLDCLGCHALDGRGGRIAPELALASLRLEPAYIRAILDDPGRHAPGTIMPRSRLPADQRATLANFLIDRTPNAALPPVYLSPLDHETLTMDDVAGTALTYRRTCSACHGTSGGGDGFNAQYLDAPPARHSDAEVMARRHDDALFDGIAGGGRVLGGSARMPAFGATLDAAEIRALVAHIRELCRCTPPAWSVDGER